MPTLFIGEVLARMRGAELRDVKLLHRSGLCSFHREFLERPPGKASGTFKTVSAATAVVVATVVAAGVVVAVVVGVVTGGHSK